MPAVLVQGTSSIAVAQPRTTLFISYLVFNYLIQIVSDGAVLAVPALAAFALAVLASSMLGAARVAGPLTAGGAGPALFTATRAPHAHSVRAAVHRTDFI